MPTTTNLVSIINQFMTPEMLGRVASALGVDRAALQKAVGAGIPGILAALTSLLAKPGGAARIESAIDDQPTGMLGNVSNLVGTAQQERVIDQGLGSLSSLLGGNTTSALSNALNRYAGLGDVNAKGLLGLLAPLVLGVLGQQTSNGRGVAQLLQSQQANIARALPSGFASYLSGTGVLDGLPGSAAAQTARSQAAHAAESARESNWLMPVLGMLALLALGWYLLGRPSTDHTAARTTPAAEMQAQTPATGGTPFVVAENDLNGWMQRPVYSSDNKKVGEIAQLVRDPQDRVTDVYMDAETTLGIGTERYHITADRISEVRPDGLVLSLTETEVRQMEKSSEPAAR